MSFKNEKEILSLINKSWGSLCCKTCLIGNGKENFSCIINMKTQESINLIGNIYSEIQNTTIMVLCKSFVILAWRLKDKLLKQL
jgi:hypothetical protein